MQKRRIVYAPKAREDRHKIGQWLARKASAEVALRFDRRISEAVQRLEYASKRGTVRDQEIGLRVIGVLPTVSVAFSVDEDAVTIHRVLYNGQNWMPEN